MDTQHLYYNVIDDSLYNSAGELIGNRSVSVFFCNKEQFTIHYVTDTNYAEDGVIDPTQWTKWTGLSGLAIGSTLAFDDDYIHAVKGTLTEGVSAGATSVTVEVSIDPTLLNPSDKLTFYNADGTNTTLLYSSYTATETGYTFELTEASAVDIASGVTVRVPQALFVKIYDVDTTRAGEGIFTFTFYAYSHKLLNAVDYTNVQSISGTLEHQIVSEGNRIRTFSFPLVISNLLDFDNDAVIPSQAGDWVNKSYVDSFFVASEIYQYSADGTNWHDELMLGDVYYRSKPDTENGVWGATRVLLYGNGIESVTQTTVSTESGGTNIITVTLESGATSSFAIRNGEQGATGVSVSNVEQTTTSTASSGTNVITVTLSDGTQKSFNVWNGAKGDKGDTGEKGATGDAFHFDAMGTLAGRDSYNDEAMGFAYLDTENGNIYIKNSDTSADWTDPIPFRGEAGADGVSITSVEQTTTSTASEGTNVITVTLSDGQTFTFNVKNGSAGATGATGADGSPGVQGPAGVNGLTPYIGTNGNWWIGAEDTGTVAAGSNMFANGVPPFEFTSADLVNGILTKTFTELSIDSASPVSVNIISGDGVIMDGDVRIAMLWTDAGLKVDLSQMESVTGTWKLVFAGGTKVEGGGGGGSGNGYVRTFVTQSGNAQSGYWHVASVSDITLTLPAGGIGYYARFSTTASASNVTIVPASGDTIDGDSEGLIIDKTSGTTELYWDGTGWVVIEAK